MTGKAHTETRERGCCGGAPLRYDAVCGSDTLKSGQHGDAFKKLQNRVKELGYYKGNRDGRLPRRRRFRAQVFQRYNKLYPSGHRLHHDALGSLYGDKASAIRYRDEALMAVANGNLKRIPTARREAVRSKLTAARFTSYCLRQVVINVRPK